MTTGSTVEVQQAILDHLRVPAANSAFAQRVLADNDQHPDEKGSIRAIALTHRQISFGWEMIVGQTIRSGNASDPLDPGFDPLSLGHLLDTYLCIPRFRRGVYEGGQG